MKIAVIGASGNVGSRVVAEALRRRHHVTALTRVEIDVIDTAALALLLSGHDVGVGATRQQPGDEGRAAAVTMSLLDAHAAAGVRFLLVGGAGSLLVPGTDGRYVADDPNWVPTHIRDLAASAIDQLMICRSHTRADWTYLSPAADMQPGIRSGVYRTGTDELLVDEHGHSHLSMEDLAVAAIDEIEHPTHRNTRFTVATTGSRHE
ncbi:MAG: NAD(P)H-binding protein [Rhodococcus sp. (in: high G+C Gram-positive bacteria)]|uniref:NAD(P)-dependent oxidoreductase n=1 Tax=Rhodococcus sp. TaxID=1831 RepID=UPI003BB6EE67